MADLDRVLALVASGHLGLDPAKVRRGEGCPGGGSAPNVGRAAAPAGGPVLSGSS